MKRPDARAMLNQFIRPTRGARAGTSVESAQGIEVGPKKPATTAGGAGKEPEQLALLRVYGAARDSGVGSGVAVCVAGRGGLVRSAASADDSEGMRCRWWVGRGVIVSWVV
jgi:hypothetical protein